MAVHEMGHTLGFWHWAACTSAMSVCYDFTEPTPVDADNYEKAYWVEAVTEVTAWSPSPGTVYLNWLPGNSAGEQLCNEKEFSIWRRNPSTGSYDTHVATAAQNSAGVSFGGQPSYGQCYRVWSVTLALPISLAGHESIGVDVRPGSGGQDRDCDYFTDVKENYIGTDPWDDCPDSSSDDAWPLDINNDRIISGVGDVLNYANRLGAKPGQPGWWQRLDLNQDGQLTAVGDVLKYTNKLGTRCTNP